MKSTTVLVSVITYRQPQVLMACLKQLQEQVFAESSWEVLVVDNCPDGSSREVVASYQQAGAKVPVHYVAHAPNHLGQARDFAVKWSDSEYIVFLDTDCIVNKSWLMDLYSAFLEEKICDHRVAALAGSLHFPSHEKRFYKSLSLFSSHFLGHLGSPQALRPQKATSVEHLPTSTVMFERQALLATGSFSSSYRFVCEDVDMSMRLRKKGYVLKLSPQPCVQHYTDSTWLSWLQRMVKFGEGRWQVMVDHFKSMALQGFLPLIFLLVLVFMPIMPPTMRVLLSGAYLLGVLGVAFYIGYKKSEVSFVPAISLLFMVTHFAYILGMAKGFLGSIVRGARLLFS